MASRRNASFKIVVNGRAADSLYGLAKHVGGAVSRLSRAHKRASASLGRRMQSATNRELRQRYTANNAMLRGRTRVETGNRTKGDYISLWASSRKVSLALFDGRWTGTKSAGATAAILRGHRKTYEHAFIASVGWRGTSGTTVKADTVRRAMYQRSMGANGKRVARGPLRRLYGPSVWEMISTNGQGSADTVRNRVVPQLESFYVAELARQMALELRRG